MVSVNLRGFVIHKGFLRPSEQADMVEDIRAVASVAPFARYKTPRGGQMSVRMTAAGKYGWVSDTRGYRYARENLDGVSWPAIPLSVLRVWEAMELRERGPDCCLVNYYDAAAKLGMHQDKDEADYDWPVVSISLGDPAVFRVGSVERGGKTDSVVLESGDVVVMGGEARLVHHGVDRIKFGGSTLLRDGGRINLTLRVVD